MGSTPTTRAKWLFGVMDSTIGYGPISKGSNPLGATKEHLSLGNERKLSTSLLNVEDENRYTTEDETQNSL